MRPNAQVSFNRSFHSLSAYWNSGNFIENIHGEYYFSSKSSLSKIKANGYITPLVSFNELLAIKSRDNKVLCIGNNGFVCDVIPFSQNNYFHKIDTNGTTLFSNTEVANFGQSYNMVAELSDSTFRVFRTDNVMYTFSKTGVLTTTVSLGIGSYSSCLPLQNSDLLVSGFIGSTPVLSIISGTNIIQTNTLVAHTFKKLVHYDGQKIMGLTNSGNIYKISSSLQSIAQASLSGVVDFVCNNDSVYFITQTGYHKMDTSFNVVSNSTITTTGVSQKVIHHHSGSIALLSDCKANVGDHSFLDHTVPDNYSSSFCIVNKHSKHEYSYNLKLVEVNTDSLSANIYGMDIFGLMYYYKVSYRAKIRVKNIGTQVVNKFRLTAVTRKRIDCGFDYFHKQFSGLNLQSGDSVEILTDMLYRLGNGLVNGTPTSTMSFCFYSTMPNDEQDKYLEDNELCESLSFVPVKLEEITVSDLNTRCFPNPFTNKLQIESEYELKAVQLMDGLGRTIYQRQINGFEFELPTEAILPGLYLLKISTEKGAVTKKVLKE